MRQEPAIKSPRPSDREALPPTRRLMLLVFVVLAFATAASASSASPTAAPIAHTARTLTGTATASLHVVKLNGSALVEEGRVTGLLTGSARATVHAGESRLYGTFTIRTASGSITGSGTATPHGLGNYQSFRGLFTATSGTGRYTHVSGHAGLYGTLNRRNDAIVAQTQGTLHY